LYAKKIKHAKENPEQIKATSIWRKYFLEYVIPWIILIALVNLAIQFKGTTELSLNNAGLVPMGEVANTMFINTLVFIIWMPLFCSKQIRPDVQLGKINSGKKLPIWAILVIIILSPIVAGVIGYCALLFGGINFVSVPIATLINILAAVIPGIFGCGIGIIWGRQREFSLIEKSK
jgi:drug/metabolite transporter (DMT)-like permease